MSMFRVDNALLLIGESGNGGIHHDGLRPAKITISFHFVSPEVISGNERGNLSPIYYFVMYSCRKPNILHAYVYSRMLSSLPMVDLPRVAILR